MTWRNVPSRRQILNRLAFMAGETTMPHTESPQQALLATDKKKPRKQAESKVNDAIIKAGRLFGSILFRNRRGMARLEDGGMFPYGLGPNGFPDNCGYTPMKITESMIGKTVAIFTAIEAKTESGVLAPHQAAVIQELKERGCIAGVATKADDVRTIIQEWGRS